MNQMSRTVGVFFRTIRAFFNRRIMAVSTYLRRVTNFSRHAMKVATNSMQTVASAVKKPTRREDYVETSQLFIAKSFLIKMALLLAALGLIGYFLVWPFILSHFFTVRFYVQDSRVPDWSGRVIVFSDPEKTLPLYAGRLEEGVLQGRGEDYDENGLLAYEGQFLDGVRSGEGTAYEDGVLCYEGQFAGGLYEGRGRRYQDGALAYEGSFAAGVASGEGVAYYPNGQEAYRGQFANDLYEGQGAAYTEAGDKLYEGSFARGLYNGSGRLYLGDNQWITAEFQDGQPAGVVQWYKGGRLYYEGEWADGRPQGYGALYNKAGETVYQGQFSRGTLDGGWLLSLPVEELRAALGAEAATTVSADGGFLIEGRTLGLTALCSFQTEEEESAVYAVYLTAPREAGWAGLLPGDEASLPEWPAGAVQQRGSASFAPLDTMNLAPGVYQALAVSCENYEATCLYDENGDAVLLGWRAQGAAPGLLDLTALADSAGAGSDGQMAAFLASLDLGEGSAADAAAENPYYGKKDPAEALAFCTTVDQAESLIDAMLLYWENAERQVALEENLTRARELLADAESSQAMAAADEEALAALEDEVTELEGGVQSCQAQRSLAMLQGQAAGIDNISAYALDQLLLCFDPSVTDSSLFAQAATAYAQSTQRDTTEARLAGMTSVVNLTEDYTQVQTAVSRYETAQANAQTAAAGYATGNLDKAGWYDALSAQADARGAVCAALAAFGREANRLNTLTGGWVATNYGWYTDQLEPLFLAAAESDAAAEAEQAAGVWWGQKAIQTVVGWFVDDEGNPFYGEADLTEAVAGRKKADKAVEVLDIAFAYWELAERQAALEEELDRTRELLDESSSDALQAHADALRQEIRSCQSHRLLLDVQAKTAGVLDIAKYDLGEALLYFDPALLNSTELAQAATEYALAAGDTPAAARDSLMASLANLVGDYSQAADAQRRCTAAEEAAAAAREAYAAGAGAKADWYAALSDLTAAQQDLYAALAAFGREANQINAVTGGWLSANFGWYGDALTPLFEAEME